MNALEARYRRILTLLPRAYRQQRAEEMLTTLLDGAAEGQRWPRLGEVTSVAGLAVRLRAGAPGGSPGARFGGRVLRRIGLAGLVIQTLLYLRDSVLALDLNIRYSHGFSPTLTEHHVLLLLGWGMICSLVLVPMAALAALLYGWRRTGRILALGPCVLTTASLVIVAPIGGEAAYAALAALSYLVAAAVLLGFHRDAPPPARRGVWLALACALVVLAAAVVIAADQFVMPGSVAARGTVILARRLDSFVVSPAGPALAIGAGVLCARKSAAWPAALFALGLPLLLIAPRDYRLVARGWTDNVAQNDLTSSVWPGFGLECLVAEVVLAGVLLWSLRRYRRRCATHGAPRLTSMD